MNECGVEGGHMTSFNLRGGYSVEIRCVTCFHLSIGRTQEEAKALHRVHVCEARR